MAEEGKRNSSKEGVPKVINSYPNRNIVCHMWKKYQGMGWQNRGAALKMANSAPYLWHNQEVSSIWINTTTRIEAPRFTIRMYINKTS